MTDSRSYFDEVSVAWDRMRTSFFSPELCAKVLRAAGVQPGTLAADIGAGTGFLTEGLLRKGVSVIAVDRSQAMLDVLLRKLPDVQGLQCRLGEGDSLPIECDRTDYVFANMFLHHVEEPEAAIREMARILKPGGLLVITDLDRHDFEFLRVEQCDRWTGFAREEVWTWLGNAGLGEVSVVCANETCCSRSRESDRAACISIFIARGRKAGAPAHAVCGRTHPLR